MHVTHKGNTLLLMPAFGGEFITTKLVSVFPQNKKTGIPSIFGSVIINDGATGRPLAMLEGSLLTALRTGAIGGLAIAWTTPRNITTLGLIGAGQQGFHQVMFAALVRDLTEVIIFDPYKKDMGNFVEKLKNMLPHITFSVAKTADECVNRSEMIITATTSETPVIPDNKFLLEGRHFIGMGSYKPSMREFPDTLFSLINEAVVDTPLAIKESGDLKIPISKNLISKEKIYTLGKLINKEIEINTNRTTFFKSVGMALFDLFVAKTVYEKAREKELGIEIDF